MSHRVHPQRLPHASRQSGTAPTGGRGRPPYSGRAGWQPSSHSRRWFLGLVGVAGLGALVPCGLAAAPKPLPLGLITGRTGGTYHTMGENLRTLAVNDSLTLEVYPSAGSLAIVQAIRRTPGIHVGFVQGDVLAYIKNFETDPDLRDLTTKLRVVCPLHLEAVHLLAPRSITTFRELKGKKVAIDEEQSGTYLTARLLFTLAGVPPTALVTMGHATALSALKQGQVDAMVSVIGPPAKFLAEATGMEGLHLVPIREPRLLEAYPETQIHAGLYPWQQTAVDTLGVRAVLMTFNYPPGPVCEAVGRLARRLSDYLPQLQAQGHLAWKQVNLHAPVGEGATKWERSPCVPKALQPSENPVWWHLEKTLGGYTK